MQLVYTVVLHPIRRELGLSFLQFGLADSIYHLSHGGWCTASKAYFAKLFDVNRTTIQRNIAVLEEKKLVERDVNTDFLRTSELWRDTVVFRERTMLLARTIDPPQNAAPPPQNAAPPRRKMRHYNNNIDKEEKETFSTKGKADPKKIPPLLEDVTDYFLTSASERGMSEMEAEVEADKFFNYWTSTGWKMSGGRGALMKNWQAASRTWMGNVKKYRPPQQKQSLNGQMSLLHEMRKNGTQ